jgi:membrane-associated protein
MFEPSHLIQSFGYLGMFGIIFAETGLLIGFFLPGDSLLLVAGLLAKTGTLSLPITILVCACGSILGDQLGYFIGLTAGPKVFNRPQSRFFDPENVTRARAFFDKYGMITIIIARFIPVVRAFAPTMAGVTKVPYSRFLPLSILGGVLWGAGITTVGYVLGGLIPNLEKYIYLVIGAGILAGVVPSAIHLLRAGKQQ